MLPWLNVNLFIADTPLSCQGIQCMFVPASASLLPGLAERNFPCRKLECSFWGCLQVTLTFPAVLERLQLKAFDLCKLIETFVRHEPLLPRELKRHLFNIEEKMLEALAFERGSSLYPRLIIACSDDLTSECPTAPCLRGVVPAFEKLCVDDWKSQGKAPIGNGLGKVNAIRLGRSKGFKAAAFDSAPAAFHLQRSEPRSTKQG